MSVPTWETVQAGIQAWIVAATGFAADRVRWGDQGGAIPTDVPWISIRVIAEAEIGAPWIGVVDDVAAPAPLADVRFVARSTHVGTLSIQVFNAAAVGSSSPLALLRRLRPASRLPSVHAALVAAGVGLGAFTGARIASMGVNTTFFEPRGVIECRFFTAAEIDETGTWIETTEIEGEVA